MTYDQAPNRRIHLSVRPVTALAHHATAAPVRPQVMRSVMRTIARNRQQA